MIRPLLARHRFAALGLAATGVVGLTVFACVPDYSVSGGADSGADVTSPDTGTHHDGGDAGDVTVAPEAGDAGDATTPPDAGDAGAVDASEGGAVTRTGPSSLTISKDTWGARLCLLQEGGVLCWGDSPNGSGELGYPADASPISFPARIPTQAVPDEIAQGQYFICFRYGNTVWCRGDNEGFQLGTTGLQQSTTELEVALPPHVVKVVAGIGFTCALLDPNDAGAVGNVLCWGASGFAEIAQPPDAGDAKVAMPGVVNLWSDAGAAQPLADAVDIFAGYWNVCALRRSGQLVCWGRADWHMLGADPGYPCQGGSGPTDPVLTCQDHPVTIGVDAGDPMKQLVMGDHHACMLTQSGKVYCWGGNDDGQLGAGGNQPPCDLDGGYHGANTPPGVSPCSTVPWLVGLQNPVTSIAAGVYHTCARDNASNVYCWGHNGGGELGRDLGTYSFAQAPTLVGMPNDEVIAIPFDSVAAGTYKTCAAQDGGWNCWGFDVLGTDASAVYPDGGYDINWQPAPVVFP